MAIELTIEQVKEEIDRLKAERDERRKAVTMRYRPQINHWQRVLSGLEAKAAFAEQQKDGKNPF